MKELRICKLNFLHWAEDPKYAVALVYLVLYSYNRIYALGAVAQEWGEKITPWLLPFMPCYMSSFLPYMLGFVLLVSDAPFRTRQQGLMMQRVGKRAWLSGQILYILAVSVGFTALLFVLSWIWFLPNMEWTADWGAVLRTAAINGGISSVYMEFPYSVIKNTDAISVTLWCACSMMAVCFLLGIIMAACNLWLRKGIGAFFIAVVCAISLILDFNSQNPGPIRYLLWISPLNWMDYSLMGYTERYLPSRAFAIYAPALLGLGIAVMLWLTIGKCNIDTDKE